ncbi:MAG: DUF4838 domain-containing protein [Lentisphaeria bacterium]|nr:DUF4838 domain-containing protein [Lentisphaeria bacterium]
MDPLTIVLKYPGAAQKWKLWADGESRIDFRNDPEGAKRCTAAYAASELRYFIGKAMPDLTVRIDEKIPDRGKFIEPEIRDDGGNIGSFILKSRKNGIRVTGLGRNGLLNGIYELLRIQGWRWLEPGPYGEIAPEKPTLDFLNSDLKGVPSFKFRMIDQYRESDASVELLKWFSRNRVNVAFRKPATGKFADKLGMYSRIGGHLLWKIMHPDSLMDDGRTLWEAHPDWFGLPPDGKRTKAHAADTQLCLSNREMLEYLSAKICDLLKHELKEIDILDLWGFDTWGNACSCPACRKLGNGSDQNLYLLSEIQSYLRKHLGRTVRLNTISYEGTATMDPPTQAIPRNLTDTDCFVIFYPIARCYEHPLGDGSCASNRNYDRSIRGWSKHAKQIGLWSGEYYNVSKFEDLPVVFTQLIPDEMRYYFAQGCTGATYMHNFSPNWGMRTLIQLMHLQYAWDIRTDDKSFADEYFRKRYGVHAARMRKAYGLTEQAMRSISTWRGYGPSILSRLSRWEGTKPEKPLEHSHLKDEREAIRRIRGHIRALEQAIELTQECIERERGKNWKTLPSGQILPLVLTPQELEKHRFYDAMEYRLGENLRGLVYGRDLYRIEAALMEYYRACRLGKDEDRYWAEVETLCDILNQYHVPVTYENPGPGVSCKDALSRSQLRRTITRCRGERQKSGRKPGHI